MDALKNEKFVSVIIPAFNAERFLREAIQSILDQGHQPLEVVVIDDGSTDETSQIAGSFGDPIRVLYQKNSGPPAARNHGLREAKGDFIGFLDADDMWAPQKLSWQLEAFHNDPELQAVGGKLQRIILPGGTQENRQFVALPEDWDAFSLGTILIRKSVFQKIGNFDEDLFMADDIDWFLRLREADIKVENLSQVVHFYRRHDQNLTGDEKRDRLYLMRALKKALDRKKNLFLQKS